MTRYIMVMVFSFAIASVVKAQNSNHAIVAKSDTRIYNIVDKEPEPPGGLAKFFDNLCQKLHPVIKPDQDIKTHLVLEMIVEKDGHLSHIKVLKSISKETDNQAIKILRKSPKWIPGTIGNKPVRTRLAVPMIIELQE